MKTAPMNVMGLSQTAAAERQLSEITQGILDIAKGIGIEIFEETKIPKPVVGYLLDCIQEEISRLRSALADKSDQEVIRTEALDQAT